MALQLPKETTEQLISSIQKYFQDELDQELGHLGARLLLEFVLTEVGAAVYNQAIGDAQRYFQERVLDLEGSCHQPEMTYWKRR